VFIDIPKGIFTKGARNFKSRLLLLIVKHCRSDPYKEDEKGTSNQQTPPPYSTSSGTSSEFKTTMAGLRAVLRSLM